MHIPDAVILHHLLPYLSLYDVAIFVIICKKTANMNQILMKNVRQVDISPGVNIVRFMKKLTQKCPNVNVLNIEYGKKIYDSVNNEINKLPLISFKYIRIDIISGTSDEYKKAKIYRFKLKIPSLKRIHTHTIDTYNLTSCDNLEVIHVMDANVNQYKQFSMFKKLKEIIIDDLTDNDHDNDYSLDSDNKFFDLPITSINVMVEHHGLNIVEKLQPKSLLLCDEYGLSQRKIFHTLQHIKLHSLSMNEIPNMNDLIRDMPLERLVLNRGIHGCMSGPNLLTKQTLRYLELSDTYVDFDCLGALCNLDTLVIHECELRSYNIDVLPIRYLTTDDSLPLEHIKNMNRLLSLNITYYNSKSNDLQYLPSSLITLKIDTEMSFDTFPLLPNLTKLIILCSYDNEYETSTQHKQISDEGFRRIALCPITHLEISCNSLNDDNIHYLARMPLNYLDIEETNVTIVGLRQLKHLPLRKLIAPEMQTHHLLQS